MCSFLRAYKYILTLITNIHQPPSLSHTHTHTHTHKYTHTHKHIKRAHRDDSSTLALHKQKYSQVYRVQVHVPKLISSG